jgi:glyoxylase-like metal-dependent hydrolase (beta-lactamase superfamily II)
MKGKIMNKNLFPFVHESTSSLSYVVRDPGGKRCAVIDPVMDYDPAGSKLSTTFADRIVEAVTAAGLEVEWILETHAHADHISAAPYIQSRLGGRTAIGEHIVEVQKTWKELLNLGDEFKTDGSQFDHLFKDGEEFRVGEMRFRVLHTPGHTRADVTYLSGDIAFIGDTMFMPDYGVARADFPGGNPRDLYHSIQKLFALPAATRLYLCHDYLTETRREHCWETTVAGQQDQNIVLNAATSEHDFVEFRTKRDKELAAPRLLFPSVQLNIRAGHLPPPESNGRTYLKIPIRT